MMEVWILGATGRVGKAVATSLASRKVPLVLVGRNEPELQKIATDLQVQNGSAKVVVADTIEKMGDALSKAGPVVVVNTVGPFTQSAVPIIRATANGSHYMDISNEVASFTDVFSMHDEAVQKGSCLVVGAGWGVVATESILVQMIKDQPPAAKVRVDVVPYVGRSGKIGPTLAATIIDSIPAGGQKYANGQMVRTDPGSDYEVLTLPDGTTVGTGAMPFGDLEVAKRTSGAPFAVAASNMVPASAIVRAMVPVFSSLFSFDSVREFAKRRLAEVTPPPTEEKPSWARARVEYSNGTVKTGWLKAGDAGVFTNDVAAEVAYRLAAGEGRPGAFSPSALFGSELARKAGGEFLFNN